MNGTTTLRQRLLVCVLSLSMVLASLPTPAIAELAEELEPMQGEDSAVSIQSDEMGDNLAQTSADEGMEQQDASEDEEEPPDTVQSPDEEGAVSEEAPDGEETVSEEAPEGGETDDPESGVVVDPSTTDDSADSSIFVDEPLEPSDDSADGEEETTDEAELLERLVGDVTEEVLAGVPTDANEADVVRFIYELLAMRVTCLESDDSSGSDLQEGASRDHQALLALRDGQSDSRGIARAFQKVLDCLKIEAIELTSADGSTWLAVKIDNSWYHVDAALAARDFRSAVQEDSATKSVSDAWLLISDERMAEASPERAPWSCVDSSQQLPPCERDYLQADTPEEYGDEPTASDEEELDEQDQDETDSDGSEVIQGDEEGATDDQEVVEPVSPEKVPVEDGNDSESDTNEEEGSESDAKKGLSAASWDWNTVKSNFAEVTAIGKLSNYTLGGTLKDAYGKDTTIANVTIDGKQYTVAGETQTKGPLHTYEVRNKARRKRLKLPTWEKDYNEEVCVIYTLSKGAVTKITPLSEERALKVSIGGIPDYATYTNKGTIEPKEIEASCTITVEAPKDFLYTDAELKGAKLPDVRLTVDASEAFVFPKTLTSEQSRTKEWKLGTIKLNDVTPKKKKFKLVVNPDYSIASSKSSTKPTIQATVACADYAYESTGSKVVETFNRLCRNQSALQSISFGKRATSESLALAKKHLKQYYNGIVLQDSGTEGLNKYFSEDQITDIKNFLYGYIVELSCIDTMFEGDWLAGKAEAKRKEYRKKVLDMLGVKESWINKGESIDVVVDVRLEDNKGKNVTFEFTLEGMTFGTLASTSSYASYVPITYKRKGTTGAKELASSGSGQATYVNLEVFRNLMMEYIKEGWNALGGDVIDNAIKKILEEANITKMANWAVSEALSDIVGRKVEWNGSLFTIFTTLAEGATLQSQGDTGTKGLSPQAETDDPQSSDANLPVGTTRLTLEGPVDVKVYDPDHTLVLDVQNGAVVTRADKVIAYANKKKTVISLVGESYDLYLKGTGKGTLTYTIEKYWDGTLLRTLVTKGVPIVAGTELGAYVPVAIYALGDSFCLVDADGNVINLTSDSYADEELRNEASHGKVLSSGTAGDGVYWEMRGDTDDATLRFYGDGEIEKDLERQSGAYPSSINVTRIVVEEGIVGEFPKLSFANRYMGDSSWYPDVESVAFPQGITKIGTYAFLGCTKLERVAFAEGLKEIGSSAFSGCSSLRKVALPSSVTTIAYGAFSKCSALASLSLPEGLKSMTGAFSQCTSLTSVHVPSTVRTWSSAFSGCTALSEVELPEGVESVPFSSFSGCTALKHINLPSTLKTVDGSAFEDCVGITSMTIPTGVTSLDLRAFKGCTNLTTLTMPCTKGCVSCSYRSNPKTLEITKLVVTGTNVDVRSNVLPNLPKLKSLSFADSVKTISGEDNKIYWHDEDELSRSLTSIDVGRGVKTIGSHAFDYCKFVKNVTIPDSVTSIGAAAFSNCDALTRVAGGKNVTKIGDEAFRDCGALSSITLGSKLTSIGKMSFSYCRKLTSISIPNSVKSLGEGAFTCSGLLSVSIGTGVSSIPTECFYISKLTSVVVPGNVKTVGTSAFCSTNLATVTLKEGVQTLKSGALNSGDLKKVSLPKSLTTIEAGAFSVETQYAGLEDSVPTITVNRTKLQWQEVKVGKSYILDKAKFKYVAAPMSKAKVSGLGTKTYTGKAIKPKPKVTYGKQTLTKGTDYTLSYKNNVDTGTATISIKGKGAYTGNKTATFKIVNKKAKSLAKAKIEAIGTKTYTGKPLTPKPTVKLDGKKLKLGTDYKLSYEDNAEAGKATVIVEGINAYKGSAKKKFTIKGKLAKAKVSFAKGSYAYTGKAVKPAPVVKLGSTKLRADKDYTVSYKSNKKVGTATVTIKGKGGYTGKVKTSFKICYDLAKAKITLPSTSYTYIGSALKPNPTVKVGSITLKVGKDYVVTYSANTKAGTASVIATGKGNAMGKAKTTFAIRYNLANASVTLPKASYAFAGSEVTPSPTVKVAGTTLKKGTDYTVTYADNLLPGKASLKIAATKLSTGTKSASFKIVGSLASADMRLTKKSYAYSGKSIKPNPTLSFAGDRLVQGKDYTLAWGDNTQPGSAYVIATGKGNYQGSAARSFTIEEETSTKTSLASATVTLPQSVYDYTGSPLCPEPVVTLEGKTLKKNSDYTLSYDHNTEVGTAQVTVTGMGDYEDAKTVTFRITWGVWSMQLSSATGPLLKPGKTLQLAVAIQPPTAAETPLVWESNNPNVASVTANGLVEAHTEGLATISVWVKDEVAPRDWFTVCVSSGGVGTNRLAYLPDTTSVAKYSNLAFVDTESWRQEMGNEWGLYSGGRYVGFSREPYDGSQPVLLLGDVNNEMFAGAKVQIEFVEQDSEGGFTQTIQVGTQQGDFAYVPLSSVLSGYYGNYLLYWDLILQNGQVAATNRAVGQIPEDPLYLSISNH